MTVLVFSRSGFRRLHRPGTPAYDVAVRTVTEPEARVPEWLNGASVNPPKAAGVMGALARGFESHRALETETSPGSATVCPSVWRAAA